jgi:hypothetical protein
MASFRHPPPVVGRWARSRSNSRTVIALARLVIPSAAGDPQFNQSPPLLALYALGWHPAAFQRDFAPPQTWSHKVHFLATLELQVPAALGMTSLWPESAAEDEMP